MQVRRQLAASRAAIGAARSSGASELPLLPRGTVLIAYLSLDDELLAFVLRDDRLKVVRGLASSAAVDAELRGLRFQLETLVYGADRLRLHMPELVARAQRRLQRLYELLLRRLDPYIDEAERLIVVPHRALHYLPFHALHDGHGYVVEQREVVYAPSLTVLRHCLSRPRLIPPRRAVLVGLADAGAPRVRDEVKRVAQWFPEAETHLDGKATLGALRNGAPGADVLHLATHGRFRPDNALFSALRLADGWLTVRDACDLDLSGCGLVALSACDTGVSQVAPGDELLGLTRGFFAAGAASLLVSLWPVDDATTVELMDCFYREMRAGAAPAAALRGAQRDLLRQHEHPFFWAGFALHGRW
jgi:CHAT domain-containing protein